MSSLFEAYITNLGKYNEGRLVGETLKFPATTEEVQALLKRIGNVLPYFDFEAYGRDVRINEGGHFAPGGYVFNNGGSFVERYHGMEDIPPEHRIFAYPKLNIREQMAAYQEVIDRSALNEEKQRLPASREDR